MILILKRDKSIMYKNVSLDSGYFFSHHPPYFCQRDVYKKVPKLVFYLFPDLPEA